MYVISENRRHIVEKNDNVKKDRGPCQIDLFDEKQVVQRFKDLLNVGPMLDINVDAEIHKFRQKLIVFGYGYEAIQALQTQACIATRYEMELEPPIRNKGNMREYEADKGRRR